MSDVPVISVRGEAMLEAEPEIAQLSVQVQSQESNRRSALDRLTERNQRCLDLVKSYGEAVEKLETSGLSITPVLRTGQKREGAVRGYRGTVSIKITIADFGVLGELITQLGDLERTVVNGPLWELRRESEAYGQAAQQAAHEAVERARSYATALGCRLVGLVELSDEGLSRDQGGPVTLAAAYGHEPYMDRERPESIDLEPATQIVRATVEARFTVTPPDLDPR